MQWHLPLIGVHSATDAIITIAYLGLAYALIRAVRRQAHFGPSAAPVFTLQQEYLGRGVVGGYVWLFEEDARRMATMAQQILAGTRANDIPPGESTHARMLDWRQLKRWNIDERLLPADTVVRFREPTGW